MHHFSQDEIAARDRLHDQMRANHELLEAVKLLNDFCDKDPRQPYYDIKKHNNGKVYLTIRTQILPSTPRIKISKYGNRLVTSERKSKKFFGKTRQEVTVAAAQYVKSGQF